MDEQQKALSQQTVFRCDTSIDTYTTILLSVVNFSSSTLQKWDKIIAKGSFLSVREENSSRRENNLTIPNRFLKLFRACYTKQNNEELDTLSPLHSAKPHALEDIPSLALW
jgi:hypothetical protein